MITNNYKKHKKLCLSMHYSKGPISGRRYNNYYGYNKYKNYYNNYKLYNYNKMTNDEYEEMQDVENIGVGGGGGCGPSYRNESSLNNTYSKGRYKYKYVEQKGCKSLLREKKTNHTSDDISTINKKNNNDKKKIIKILKRPTEEEIKKAKKINSKEEKSTDIKRDEKSNNDKCEDKDNVQLKQLKEGETHSERYPGRDYEEEDKKKEQQKRKKRKEKKKKESQDVEEKEDKQKKERKEKKLKKKEKEEKSKKDNKTITKTKKSKDQFKFSSTQELFNLLLKDVKKEEDFLESINEPKEKEEKKKQKKEGVESNIKERRSVIDKISSRIGKLNNKYEANKAVGEMWKKNDVYVICKENERNIIKNKNITLNGNNSSSNNNNNNNSNSNKNNKNKKKKNCEDEAVGRTSADVYHKGCMSHLNNHLNNSGSSTYHNLVDNKETIDKIYVDSMINHHNNMNVNNFAHVMNMTCNNNSFDKKDVNVDEHSNVRIHGKVVISNNMRKGEDNNNNNNNSNSNNSSNNNNNNNNNNNGNNIIIGNNDVMRYGKKEAMWKDYVLLKNKRSKHKYYNTTNNNINNNSNVEKMNINNISTHVNNKKQTSKIMKNLEKKCHSKFATVLLGSKRLEQKHETGRVVQKEEEARKINMRMGNVNYMMKYGHADKITLNGMNQSKNENMNMSDSLNLSGNNMNNTSPRASPASASASVPAPAPGSGVIVGVVSHPSVTNYNSKTDVSNNKTANIKKEEEAGQFVIPLYMRSPKPEQIPIPLYFSEGENIIMPTEDVSVDEKNLMKVAVNNEMNDNNIMDYANGTIFNNNNMNNMVTMNPLSSCSYNLNDTNNNLLNDPMNNHVRMFKEKLANAQYVKTKNYTRNLKEYLFMNLPKDKNALNYSKKKKKTFLNRNYVTFNVEVNNHNKLMGVNHDVVKSADRNNMKSVNGSIYNNNNNNSSSINNNISNGMNSFHTMKASYYNGCNLNKGGRYFKVDKYFYSRKYKVRTHFGDNNGHHKYRHFQFLKDMKIAVY
ncbi:conserved Plasmodium protein, unknown function [Plasmodium sp. DRC-Itaito]|nr:conserved Plasmodium protein, unknown function [Plasmodium sp. DRC-Itaito]